MKSKNTEKIQRFPKKPRPNIRKHWENPKKTQKNKILIHYEKLIESYEEAKTLRKSKDFQKKQDQTLENTEKIQKKTKKTRF